MADNSLSHVALILDGNKRWAKKNNLNSKTGYKKGFDNIKKIIDCCLRLNIPNVTLFTLSSENYKRSSINLIYEIIYNNFSQLIDELINKQNIKINIFGSRINLPAKVIDMFDKAEKISNNNKSLNLNIAFNYGFKEEIKEVLKKFKSSINDIDIENNEQIRKLFYLGYCDDPDVLIRTGGYKRLSNFIMYNLTYTELFFTDTLWPEFSTNEFEKIVNDYLKINRKYGL